jgi:hypothetical protein
LGTFDTHFGVQPEKHFVYLPRFYGKLIMIIYFLIKTQNNTQDTHYHKTFELLFEQNRNNNNEMKKQ